MNIKIEEPETLRRIFKKNKPTDEIYLVAVKNIPGRTLFFMVTYLPHYGKFVARPVEPDGDGNLEEATVRLPSEWHRFLKHHFRTQFCVRSIIDVNDTSNEYRVNELIGMRGIIVVGEE